MNRLQSIITAYNKRLNNLIDKSVRYDYSINKHNREMLDLLKIFDNSLFILREDIKKDKSYPNKKLILNKINYLLNRNKKYETEIKKKLI